MALSTGSRIGPYEISSKIGEGGMGEVFRAVDVNLGRTAAIKVLPTALAGDADRLARFEREAQTLASLNHPNIAQVFGFEKGEGTFRAIAMEYVEGPTLAERIAGAPVAIDDAIPIAMQIADALECAHDHGIIHRDLKPQNIKVRPDGTVKVLDFGLAKAIAPTTDYSSATAANSPTITTPAMTHAGVVVGTASYMSPEQAKGRVVDRRADIWAFGCVLFEMLSGKRAFDGPEVSDVYVSVLRDEPPWAALPADTPPHVRSLLRRCLQKDPRKRLPHIGVARLELAEGSAEADRGPGAAAVSAKATVAGAAVLGIALGAIGAAIWSRPAPTPAPAVRLLAELGTANAVALAGSMALSPDGTVLAFTGRPARSGLGSTIYVRRLDGFEAQHLPGTDGAQGLFFSPDGRWIAFFAGGALKRIAVTGGEVISICAAPAAGGSWDEDDTIVFASQEGLSRVAASGGTPVVFAKASPGQPVPSFPRLLPRRRGVLYVQAISSEPASGQIMVHDLASGTSREIIRGGRSPSYTASGHLAFVRAGALLAVPFDLDALLPIGEPVRVLEGVVQVAVTAAANMALSDNGALAYQPDAAALLREAPLMWLTRTGPLTPLRQAPAAFVQPRFSPDGRRIAMAISDGRQFDIWVYDWERDVLTLVTSDPGTDLAPVWTADGTGLVFSSTRDSAVLNLYWQRADGTGAAIRLTTSPRPQMANAIDPEGRRVVFHEGDPGTGRQSLGVLPIERDGNQGWKAGTPATLVGGPFLKSYGRISPDGKWMAYSANDTGRFEIYVQPFPGPGERLQVSSGGGSLAAWSKTKSELYYTAAREGRLMAVAYTASDAGFRPEKPRPWSDTVFSSTPPVGLYGPGWDMHPDSQRFAVAPAMTGADTGRSGQVALLFNFFDELRRVAPVR